MSGSSSDTLYLGWDVGGWNCDRNPRSRDAIVILDAARSIIGKPWRGNLRSVINDAGCTMDWIDSLFSLCKSSPKAGAAITLAIDTPLGFSAEFLQLVNSFRYAEPIENSSSNPYLFRQTERFLFERGLTPLSSVKDMIGSQATKGIHALAKFAPNRTGCGVWSDGRSLTAIEAYPSPCKKSESIRRLRAGYQSLGHDDHEDALTCALIAFLFAKNREALASPPAGTPRQEGWIWIPTDALQGASA